MTSLEPAAVVSFHPLLNRAAVRARRRLGLRVPIVTAITDLVDVHLLSISGSRPGDRPLPGRAGSLPSQPGAGRPPGPGGPARSMPASPAMPRTRKPAASGGSSSDSTPIGSRCWSAAARTARRHRAPGAGARGQRAGHLPGGDLRAQPARRGRPSPASVTGGTVRSSCSGFVTNMAQWMTAADIVVTKAGPGRSQRRSAPGSPCSSPGSCPVRSGATWSGSSTPGPAATCPGTPSWSTRLPSWRCRDPLAALDAGRGSTAGPPRGRRRGRRAHPLGGPETLVSPGGGPPIAARGAWPASASSTSGTTPS